MRTEIVEGAIYGDCDLGGNFAYLVPEIDVTVNKSIHKELPIFDGHKENVLFLRWGDGILGGQGASDKSGIAWVNKGPEWIDLGKTFGVNPIAFSPEKLYIVRGLQDVDVYSYKGQKIELIASIKKQIGTQGIRYIDNRGEIITGDSTYDGSKNPLIDLAEYTLLDSVTIGQSYVDGAIIAYQGLRKVIEPGNCRFVRAYRLDGQIAVGITKLSENKVVFKWFLLNEISSFPDEGVKTPPIVIPPVEPPTTTMKLPNAVKATRDAFIHKFPFPTIPQDEPVPVEFDVIFRNYMRKMIEQIVFSNPNQGWGWKSADESRPPSKDSLANNKLAENDLLNWDMFGGVGTGRPTLNIDPDSSSIKGQHFIDVTGVNHLELPGPLPIPNPPVDNSDLIKNLQRRVSELEASVLKNGSRIAFITESGKYVCFESGGNLHRSEEPVSTDRDRAGSWETVTVEVK